MTTITSKFTKERLIDWAVVAVAERVRDLKDASESVEAAANLKLAEITLASLTAEPVAWTDEEELRDLRKVGFCEMFSVEPISKDADMLRVIPLYRHAQPAPVVPDAYVRDERGRMMLNGICEPKIGFGSGWNACRAAMLQAGDTVRDLSTPVDPQVAEYEQNVMQAGNSPVIPDGYALVPVEPTDEMIAAAMNCEDVLFNSDESFCVQFGNIYAAMLAAAPQQEVK
ncbi:hypothetical protein ID363_002662 [Salmonella enterica]|nr:hypothetical protein [Salmonella enterica]EEE0535556.1 hypothetical protein [Salmonella enterica subsp. enterica serovar Javiana]EBJ4624289.1 hypothetical protein [Salmonella enterica]EBK8801152.1 hypothetical protein [Salmonella enterica]ECO5354074.1 hypothetical protein [Salmonella enterica]